MATKIGLIALFHAKVAGVVARAIVVVFFDFACIDFTNVTEHIGSSSVIILSQDTLLNEESGEAIELFLEAAIILSGEVGHERLWAVERVVGVLAWIFEVGHTLVERLTRDLQRVAEVGRVERLHIARNHHHIVGRLVEHHELAIAVVHESARRVECFAQESVCVGIYLVFVVTNL